VAELEIELSSEEIGRIAGFLGYGSLSKSVWFIGIEEGLGKMNSDEARGNLKARGSFERTMDLHEAHLRLREERQPIDIEKKQGFTQAWLWIARIMLAVEKRADCRNTEAVKAYIRCRLGRCDGGTFLTELSPIPSGRAADKCWVRDLKRRDPGLDIKVMRRKDELKRILGENPPPLVVCYGKSRANEFAKLLDVEWNPQPDCPGVSASADRKRLLLPFFGQSHMTFAVFDELLLSGILGQQDLDGALGLVRSIAKCG
jgi:hypothetical protein